MTIWCSICDFRGHATTDCWYKPKYIKELHIIVKMYLQKPKIIALTTIFWLIVKNLYMHLRSYLFDKRNLTLTQQLVSYFFH